MFEFNVNVSCPYCGEDQYVIACFDYNMEPVTTTEDCDDCYKPYTVTPWEPDIDAYTDKVKKPRKKKTEK